MPQVSKLDHLVLTVMDVDRTIAFYTRVLGMQAQVLHPADGTMRTALQFGTQKINLHPAAAQFEPKATMPVAGSADICFLSDDDLTDWQAYFAAHDVAVIDGPIARTGATGPILSLYIRDPDGNLIEVSNPA
jgi:catechol 2,3-dioxygenase-like lactoylglutathione lyase family enzyme